MLLTVLLRHPRLEWEGDESILESSGLGFTPFVAWVGSELDEHLGRDPILGKRQHLREEQSRK